MITIWNISMAAPMERTMCMENVTAMDMTANTENVTVMETAMHMENVTAMVKNMNIKKAIPTRQDILMGNIYMDRTGRSWKAILFPGQSIPMKATAILPMNTGGSPRSLRSLNRRISPRAQRKPR